MPLHRHLSPGGLDVAEALLALDPARRPTADEALKLPYFTTEEPKAEMPTMCVCFLPLYGLTLQST